MREKGKKTKKKKETGCRVFFSHARENYKLFMVTLHHLDQDGGVGEYQT